jgi:hypothetical protein
MDQDIILCPKRKQSKYGGVRSIDLRDFCGYQGFASNKKGFLFAWASRAAPPLTDEYVLHRVTFWRATVSYVPVQRGLMSQPGQSR